MINLGILILLIIATEAVTEIIVASEFPLLLWFRNCLTKAAIPNTPRKLHNISLWHYIIVAIHKLFTCGYCFSVWTAGVFALFAPNYFEHIISSQWSGFCNWVCITFVLHRASNLAHVLFELVKRGRVKTHDLNVSLHIMIADGDGEEDEEGEGGEEDEEGEGEGEDEGETDDLIDMLERD